MMSYLLRCVGTEYVFKTDKNVLLKLELSNIQLPIILIFSSQKTFFS